MKTWLKHLIPNVGSLLLIALLLLTQSAVAGSVGQQGPQPAVVVQPIDPNAVNSPSSLLFSYQGQLLDAVGNPINRSDMLIIFNLYTVATGGTACWTESHTGANAVNVQKGLFHVLLGQITVIPSACLTGDAYLELVVNGETLSPRELLTSVAFAVEAQTMPHDAVVRGNLNIRGDLIAGAPGEEFTFHTRSSSNGDFLQITSRDNGGDWKWFSGIVLNDASGNVGIGTTAPKTALHIPARGLQIGTSGTATDNFHLAVETTFGPNALRLFNGDYGAGAHLVTVLPGGNVGIGTANPQTALHIAEGKSARLDLGPDQKLSLGGAGSFEIDAPNVVGGRFVVTNDGKVGIGRQAPSDALDVAGNVQVRGAINVGGDARVNGNASVGGNLVAGGNISASGLALPTDPSSGVGWNGVSAALGRAANDGNYSVDARAGDLVLRPSGGKRLILTRGEETVDHPAAIVIDPSGNVGIGTTDPRGKLEVNGGVRAKMGVPTSGNANNGGYSFEWDGDSGLFGAADGQVELWANNSKVMKVTAGNVDVYGAVNCNALVENNLQTEAERAADKISRFGESDVLCWSPETEQLELCTTANDRLVMAVADPNGRPIVMGAEKVKVLGPVLAGDILVASDVAGYAMVNNEPRSGSVIAQALENFSGERGVIKAMIRKW